MNNVQEAAETAVAASAATKVMYSGAAVAALSINDLLGWVGAATALGGFIVNLYFRRRQDRREEREHQRRMQEREQED